MRRFIRLDLGSASGNTGTHRDCCVHSWQTRIRQEGHKAIWDLSCSNRVSLCWCSGVIRVHLSRPAPSPPGSAVVWLQPQCLGAGLSDCVARGLHSSMEHPVSISSVHMLDTGWTRRKAKCSFSGQMPGLDFSMDLEHHVWVQLCACCRDFKIRQKQQLRHGHFSQDTCSRKHLVLLCVSSMVDQRDEAGDCDGQINAWRDNFTKICHEEVTSSVIGYIERGNEPHD